MSHKRPTKKPRRASDSAVGGFGSGVFEPSVLLRLRRGRSTDLTRVPDSFRSIREYRTVFEPLLLGAPWQLTHSEGM